VGVDAGATKTEAVAFTPNGELLAQAFEGEGNVVACRETATENILHAIQRVLPNAAEDDAFVCVGAAGAETGENGVLLRDFLERKLPHVCIRIMSDLRLALYAAHRGGDGIVIIAGTGSSALAKHGDNLYRAGGWGQLLGDEGGGYDIVRAAFRRVTSQYEMGEGYDALSLCILGHLDTDVFGAVQYFHASSKGEIAALLPLIVEQAESGDVAAIGLLRDAGCSLAELVIRLCVRAGFEGETEVRCIGSVLRHVEAVRESFTRRLAEREPRVLPSLEAVHVPLGALYVYREVMR